MFPYSYQLKRDAHGRIIEKTETVAGEAVKWTYAYDDEGRLTEAYLGTRRICQCYYDKEGRRISDAFPATHGSSFRNFNYTLENRLLSAGENGYTHDRNGFRRLWSHRGVYTIYEYAPDYRLLSVEVEDNDTRYTFEHNENGQRVVKLLNGQPVEGYLWMDFIRLAGFHDGTLAYEFAYGENDRLPAAVRDENGAVGLLFYDQVGSLRVVADENGNVIKEILYDPFGGIIEDTNPALRIPLGFAGGLHDRDLGLVRFGWRDYDSATGRWTAPDPVGDAGGDPDWYGYCLDDPVNLIDPLGLVGWGFGGSEGHSFPSGGPGKDSDKGKGGSQDKGNGGWGFSPGGKQFPGGGYKGDPSQKDGGAGSEGSDSEGNGPEGGQSLQGPGKKDEGSEVNQPKGEEKSTYDPKKEEERRRVRQEEQDVWNGKLEAFGYVPGTPEDVDGEEEGDEQGDTPRNPAQDAQKLKDAEKKQENKPRSSAQDVQGLKNAEKHQQRKNDILDSILSSALKRGVQMGAAGATGGLGIGGVGAIPGGIAGGSIGLAVGALEGLAWGLVDPSAEVEAALDALDAAKRVKSRNRRK